MLVNCRFVPYKISCFGWRIIISACDFFVNLSKIGRNVLCSSKLLLDRPWNFNQTFEWTFIRKWQEQSTKFVHLACITSARHCALDFSRLFYCSTVWSNTSQTNLSKLKAVHNFACCIVSGKTKVDHISSVLKEFGWLPVNELFYYRDVIMTFKCMTGHAPRYF